MDDGLFYSEEALMNRVIFLSEHNDINIFVEDIDKEYEYENIFNRMFNYQININHIFAMNGKIGVEKAFKQYGEVYDGKPSIYLVDGDFDLIMGKDMIEHPNYIYLEKYNIESYYIDRRAIIRFVSGKIKKRQRDVEEIVQFDLWSTDTYGWLQTLFLNYILVQDKFPNEKNVGIPGHSYLKSNGLEDEVKIKKYVDTLKERVSDYENLIKLIYKKYVNKLNEDSTRLICGKYLLASLSQYLRKRVNKPFKEEDFKYYLLSEFDITCLNYVKNRVERVLASSK